MAGPSQMSRGRLTLILYPLAAGAMAVNLFFAFLIASWVGVPVLSPVQALLGGAVLGWPASWLFSGHMKRLMAKADGAA